VLVYRRAIDQTVRSSLILLLLAVPLLALAGATRPVDRVLSGTLRLSSLSKATGIVGFYERANEYVATGLRNHIRNASQEIFVHGVSFYITIVDRKDDLLDALGRGVLVRFLVYDPTSPGLEETAMLFGQNRAELARECVTTIDGLRELMAESRRRNLPGALEVRVFKTAPRMRLYVFDRLREEGRMVFVPHIDQQNSPNAPAYEAENTPGGVARPYIEGALRLWNLGEPFEAFVGRYDTWRKDSAS
jgi:hypothetical protein